MFGNHSSGLSSKLRNYSCGLWGGTEKFMSVGKKIKSVGWGSRQKFIPVGRGGAGHRVNLVLIGRKWTGSVSV